MTTTKTRNYIWTDNEQTRTIIWDRYEGFLENYDNYMMYLSLGREHRVAVAGMYRYAMSFYEETRVFFDKISGLNKDDVAKAKAIIEGESTFSKKDYHFLRRFFNDFMFYSGIKNVIMQRDTSTNYDKAAKEWGINEE